MAGQKFVRVRLSKFVRTAFDLTIIVIQAVETNHSTRIFFENSNLYLITRHKLLSNQWSRFCLAYRSAAIVAAPTFGTLTLVYGSGEWHAFNECLATQIAQKR